MTLKTDVDQLAADAALVHSWAHGTGTVSTEGGALRTPAKLIADKSNEIDIAAQGVLALSTTQAASAAASAAAAQTAKTGAEAAQAGAEAAWTAALAANPDLNPAVRMNPSTIATDTTIPSGYNAYSAGPLTVGEGAVVTVNDNATWSIL